MNKNALIIGGIVLAAIVLLPIALGGASGNGASSEGEQRYEDLEDRWRNYQVPEYAARMGLNRVSRDFFDQASRARSYDGIVQRLGIPGTLITDPADLPPTEWSSTHNYYASRIESPEYDLYLWVNEYDCVMVVVEQDGEIVHSFAGMHPEGIR